MSNKIEKIFEDEKTWQPAEELRMRITVDHAKKVPVTCVLNGAAKRPFGVTEKGDSAQVKFAFSLEHQAVILTKATDRGTGVINSIGSVSKLGKLLLEHFPDLKSGSYSCEIRNQRMVIWLDEAKPSLRQRSA